MKVAPVANAQCSVDPRPLSVERGYGEQFVKHFQHVMEIGHQYPVEQAGVSERMILVLLMQHVDQIRRVRRQ
jgi:hypothetical protein